MPTNAYQAGPVFTEVRVESLDEIRAAREQTERLLGFPLPKSSEELRLEQDAAQRSETRGPA